MRGLQGKVVSQGRREGKLGKEGKAIWEKRIREGGSGTI